MKLDIHRMCQTYIDLIESNISNTIKIFEKRIHNKNMNKL